MRAAIRRGKPIVCDEIPALVPGAGQVLVRTCACGICGSDLHAPEFPEAIAKTYEASGIENPMRVDADVVFGHEFSAEILDYGPGAQKRFKPGTIVTSVPRLSDKTGAHVIGYSDAFPGG